MPDLNVCVYCGSSGLCNQVYLDAAYRLGKILAQSGHTVICGGGMIGLMGYLSEGALEHGGRVIGIIPRFMMENGWGNTRLTELKIVDTIHDRKKQMISNSNVFIALPGGCGTFEELLETITWKQLGLHNSPIYIMNINGYFGPLFSLLDNCLNERFMSQTEKNLWTEVKEPELICTLLENSVSDH